MICGPGARWQRMRVRIYLAVLAHLAVLAQLREWLWKASKDVGKEAPSGTQDARTPVRGEPLIQAEFRDVARVPLEVVHQRPEKDAPHVVAVTHGLQDLRTPDQVADARELPAVAGEL